MDPTYPPYNVQRIVYQSVTRNPPGQMQVPVPMPMQQVPMQQVTMQQVPMQQNPIQQAPMQQVAIQQTPFQQAPMQQVPIQQVPIQQAPIQQVPIQQAPIVMYQPPPPPPPTQQIVQPWQDQHVYGHTTQPVQQVYSGYSQVNPVSVVEAPVQTQQHHQIQHQVSAAGNQLALPPAPMPSVSHVNPQPSLHPSTTVVSSLQHTVPTPGIQLQLPPAHMSAVSQIDTVVQPSAAVITSLQNAAAVAPTLPPPGQSQGNLMQIPSSLSHVHCGVHKQAEPVVSIGHHVNPPVQYQQPAAQPVQLACTEPKRSVSETVHCSFPKQSELSMDHLHHVNPPVQYQQPATQPGQLACTDPKHSVSETVHCSFPKQSELSMDHLHHVNPHFQEQIQLPQVPALSTTPGHISSGANIPVTDSSGLHMLANASNLQSHESEVIQPNQSSAPVNLPKSQQQNPVADQQQKVENTSQLQEMERNEDSYDTDDNLGDDIDSKTLFIDTSSGTLEALTVKHDSKKGRGSIRRGRGRGRGRGKAKSHQKENDENIHNKISIGSEDMEVSSSEAMAIKSLIEQMRSSDSR